MPWISKNEALTDSEMKNNADLVIKNFKELAINAKTIVSVLANMQAESTINPGRYEGGVGPGYGLIQWTPKTALIEHASNMGISDYENGDNQLAVAISEITGNPATNNSWYTTEAFISPYYPSGATPDMIGITGQQFLENSMGWSPEKLTILYMCARLRPSYDPDVNHATTRIEYAKQWADYVPGGGGSIIPGWNVPLHIQYGAVAENLRRLRRRRT